MTPVQHNKPYWDIMLPSLYLKQKNFRITTQQMVSFSNQVILFSNLNILSLYKPRLIGIGNLKNQQIVVVYTHKNSASIYIYVLVLTYASDISRAFSTINKKDR